MCGIAGQFNYAGYDPVDPAVIHRMTDVIAYRGPDGEGHFINGRVGLGHRRLSILDLSDAGKQPMCNEDESVWIIFNGEIYNFQELRDDLVKRGHVFRSSTDTEVIVHLYEERGDECVNLLRGMFSFAIWDSRNERLVVARDRVGIKPLYYRDDGKSIVFGSEIKSLLADKEANPQVNLSAIDRFLTHRFSPGEETLFEGISKLKPAHLLVVDRNGVRLRQFWELQFGDSNRRPIRIDDAASQLDELLSQVTRAHMISDVPVGFLASGGIDSTALLSYAAEQTQHKIQTFTVGFGGESFADERPYARLASEKFGTTHYETSITAQDFQAFLSDFVWHMEEPVCEPPAIALYYVSKLASRHVKVLLSGEGGDEAFGGYPEYRSILWLERLKRLPAPLRGASKSLLAAASRTHRFERLGRYLPLLSMPLSDYYFSRISSPITKHSAMKQALYTDDFKQAVQTTESREYSQELFSRVKGQSCVDQMLFIDTKTWLPDDLLIKADKITMANSVELRVPFLDHKVLEFAAALPSQYKVNGFASKRVLKRAFQGRIPSQILTRKKTGFPVPFANWLTHDLKDFVADTLLSGKATSRGYFRKPALEALMKGDLSGAGASNVFSLVVLELWHQRFIDTGVAAHCSAMMPAPAQ